MTSEERVNIYSSDFDIFAKAFFEKAKEIYKSKEHTDYENWKSNAVTIILSVVAIEAYVNGYSAHHFYKRQRNHSIEGALSDFLLDKNNNVSLDEKLILWPKILTGKTFDKSKEPWCSYKQIIKIRNKLVHSKVKYVDSNKMKENFRNIEFSEDFSFWKIDNYNEINNNIAKKALKTVVNIVNKLREFSNWKKLKSKYEPYKVDDI